MNNVRDAPLRSETFPKEQERAPRGGEHPPGVGGHTLQGMAQSTVTTPKPDPATSPRLGAPCALPWGISLFLQPAWRRMKPRDPFDPAKPNRGTKREETILQSPRHAPPRHREHGQGERRRGGTQHQTKSHSPSGKQRGARSPRGYPPVPRHARCVCVQGATRDRTQLARGLACATRVPRAGAGSVFAHTRAQARGDRIKC